MKYIWRLELEDGTIITTGDPWLDENGSTAKVKVELEPGKVQEVELKIFAIRFMMEVEVDVTDEDDDDSPSVMQRYPAHYQLISYALLGDGRSVPCEPVDIIPATRVKRERQKRSQKDVQQMMKDLFEESGADDDDKTVTAPPTNGSRPDQATPS